jgi:short subunit dehydrogenase-like uncharacterized protein
MQHRTRDLLIRQRTQSINAFRAHLAELDVFLAAQRRHADARAAGIVICPGVGFDVIPTDCVAAVLKQALSDATHLVLAFDARTRVSRGTARTMGGILPPRLARRQGASERGDRGSAARA